MNILFNMIYLYDKMFPTCLVLSLKLVYFVVKLCNKSWSSLICLYLLVFCEWFHQYFSIFGKHSSECHWIYTFGLWCLLLNIHEIWNHLFHQQLCIKDIFSFSGYHALLMLCCCDRIFLQVHTQLVRYDIVVHYNLSPASMIPIVMT